MRYLLFALSSLCLIFLSACQPSEDVQVSEQTGTSDVSVTNSQTIIEETPEERERRLRATFPAQQRPPGDPEIIARGETMYRINCRSCHGDDLRGGDLGGPNLLRSPVVLKDVSGEEIIPIVQNGRSTPGMTEMPALALIDTDIQAIAEYIHSIVSTSQGQGAPPPIDIELDIVVGDVEAGRAYFDQECTACHSVSGDLANYASRLPNPESVQNSWVAGRRYGAPNPNADPSKRAVQVTVTLSNGEVVSGELGTRDDFIISLTTDEGRYRSFTLYENTDPAVVDIQVDDPLQRHRELLSELTDDMMHNVTAYLVTLQ